MFKRIIICMFIFSLQLSAQIWYPQELTNKNPGEKNIIMENKPGHFYQTMKTRDEKIEIRDIDLTEELNIIVEFKDEPLFLTQQNQKFYKATAEPYKVQFTKFSSDFENIRKIISRQLDVEFKPLQITNTYYKIFNGMSMRVQRGMIPGIYSLSYIKNVHEDYEVKANLKESVPLIKADSVWYQFGNQGDSIVVAVIDCGIDYNHPALGKGFGKGYKVIGGYDFVNKDNDPMDDNGHGTHVAGIIAGNCDSIKGVAPRALLMAFKVMDANGSGYQSNIIAGIERAVDPNNDGNRNDKVDIANMSLGGSGGPEDALSKAVDNAVKLGVVFCVSAGNSGTTGFFSLGSPATARLAITVGASGRDDKMADFSSRGPNGTIFTIKPNIVAPGVSINSSLPHESYAKYSGTSMAAPHIAGVCALLKRMHPTWGPDEIKSAIMLTSKDLGDEIMSQGAGRVDAYKAAKLSTMVIPAELNLGLDNVKQDIWNPSGALKIKNESGALQQYKISYTGLAAGIDITSTQPEFSLSSGDSVFVVFNFQINNNILPIPPDKNKGLNSFAYSGYIEINGTKDQMHVPWAFLKSATVLLRFSKPTDSYFLSNDQHVFWNRYGPSSQNFQVLIIPGKYDLFSYNLSWDSSYSGPHYRWTFQVKENLELGMSDIVDINMNDANNVVKFKGKDQYGNTRFGPDLSNSMFFGCAFHFPGAEFNFLNNIYTDILTTSFSDRIKFHPMAAATASSDNKIWLFDFNKPKGIYNSTELTNDYTKFVEQKFTMNIPSNIQKPKVKVNYDYILWDSFIGYFGLFLNQANIQTDNNKCTGSFYLTPADGIETIRLSVGLILFSGDNIYHYYDPINLYSDSIGMYSTAKPANNIYKIKTGNELLLNTGLIYPDNNHLNNYLQGNNYGINLYSRIVYYGYMQEYRSWDKANTIITIYDANNILIKMDTIKNITRALNVPSGKYRTEIINNNYYIQNQQGKSKLVSGYDLSLSDPNPPSISSLQIRNSGGIPANKLEKNETGTLYFSAKDNLISYTTMVQNSIKPVPDDSTQVYVKEYGSKIWNKIKVTKISQDTLIGCYYSADLSQYTNHDSSALDIKLVLYDKSGNYLQYTLEPAIAVGKFVGSTTGVKEDETIIASVPKEYKLNYNYPNPFNPSTVISYSLPEKAKVKIEIYNILGQKVTTLFDNIKEAGNHKIEWDAKKYSSGIYFCRMSAAGTRIYEKTQKLVMMK